MGPTEAPRGGQVQNTGKTRDAVGLDHSLEEGHLRGRQRTGPTGGEGGEEAPQSCSRCWHV